MASFCRDYVVGRNLYAYHLNIYIYMYLMMIKHHCCWCGMFLKQSHSGMVDMGSMKLDTQ